MADRTVKVSLILQASGYMSGIDQVAQKTAHAGSEIDKLNQKKAAFSQLGAGMMAIGAAAAVGVGAAISRFAEFDQQMSYVSAATHETAANMDLLRDAAIKAGARTTYSAAEAAGAIEELAKAGVSTADILSGGLDAALDLAAAGGMEVAEAASVAATTLKQFNLEGEDASHVADLLAAGAGKAQGDVSDMSAALSQSGLVANQFKLSVDETVGTLSAFASAGMLGSDAGTSFRTMLLRLANPTGESAAKMKELGINAYDAQGNFVGMAGLAGQLEKGLAGLTDEQRNASLAIIFGQDAIRGANVLLESGAKGIEEWTEKVDDQGYAAETARERIDNLAGDLEALGGVIDSVLIQSGSGANAGLRDLTQTATGLVGMFGELPAPILEVGTYLGLAAAGVGLVGGAAMVATPRIAEFRAIIGAAGMSMKGLSLAAGGVTLGLTAAIGIVSALAQEHAAGRARVDSYASAIRSGTKATQEYVAQQLAMNDSFLFMDIGNAIENAEKLGVSTDEVTAALKASDAEYAAFVKRVRLLGGEFGDSARSAVQLTDKTDELRAEQALAEQQIRAVDEAQRSLTGSTEELVSADESAARAASRSEDALRDLAGAARDGTFDVDELSKAISGFGSSTLDTRDAQRQFEAALDDLEGGLQRQREEYELAHKSLDGFVYSLDVGTDAGRENEAALDAIAQRAIGVASSMITLTGSEDDARDAIQRGRDELILKLAQFNITGEAAEAYADQLGLIPENVSTAVGLDGIADAQARAQSFIDTLNRIPKSIRTGISAETIVGNPSLGYKNAIGNYFENGTPRAFAAGGWASGIYPATTGGIHKFAEAGHDEAYITMDPAHRGRSVDIWEQVGNRLGAWRPEAPMAVVQAPAQQQSGPGVELHMDGTFYGYDPHDIARAAEQRASMAMALQGLV